MAIKYQQLDSTEKKVILGTTLVISVLGFVGISSYLREQKIKKMQETARGIFEASADMPVNFASLSAQIYDAFYNYMGGMFEDEERAMDVLKSIDPKYTKALGITYYSLYGKILIDDFIKYLSPDQYQQVKHYFTQN